MSPGPPPTLVATGLQKSYPGVHAVRGVDLALQAGRVHALVGENGAGKSTFVRMLAGAVEPDAGRIDVLGRPMTYSTPGTAIRSGVAAIHQEPNIVPALSPVANVFLGQPRSRGGFLAEAPMRARFRSWCEQLGVDLPATGAAGALSIGEQQTIEIIRALERGARVMIMDEPTASLGREERERLFGVIDVFRRAGTAIVFISHHLDEVLRIADTVSVMRDGRRVMTVPAADTTPDRLVEAMLGRELDAVLDGSDGVWHPRPPATTPDRLRVSGLRVPGVLHGVDLRVRPGEIVGVAGLVGSGRTALLRALAGVEPAAVGSMWIDGQPVPWPTSPRRGMRLGLALAPEDRRRQGLVLSLSGAENLALPSMGDRRDLRLASPRRLARAVGDDARRVAFDTGRLRDLARTLSGGNQQKLVLGKLLATRPKVLLVDEPGRGVDVGAKAEIFRLLRGLAADGTSIVVVTEEIEELLALADTTVVLRRGELVTTLARDAASSESVLKHMFPVAA